MVFLRVSASLGLRLPMVVLDDVHNGQQLEQHLVRLCQENPLPPLDFLSLHHNGRPLGRDQHLAADATVDVLLAGGLPGGKGGFGSMLRALGAQIEKTTNKEACRDLSGRRLRDKNEEERLKNYVDKMAEREQEAKVKKEAKLEKLRRLAKGENKHEFHDPKYIEEREQATDRVHDAMEQAMKSKEARSDGEPVPSTSGAGTKRKLPAADVASKSAKSAKSSRSNLFLGLDLNDSDLDSSDDDDDDSDDDRKDVTAKSPLAVECK